MKYTNNYAEFDESGVILEVFPHTEEILKGMVWADDLEGLVDLLYDLGAKDDRSEHQVVMSTPLDRGRHYAVMLYQDSETGLVLHNASDGDPDILTSLRKLVSALSFSGSTPSKS